MIEEKEEEKKEFSICLRVGGIEAGPPLSTILGNYGVNTIEFVKDLNLYLQNLPSYLFLVINVIINQDKSYYFKVNEPSVGQFIKYSIYKKTINILGQGGWKPTEIKVIKLSDIYKICYMKFGNCDEKYIRIIYGSVSSFNIYISYD